MKNVMKSVFKSIESSDSTLLSNYIERKKRIVIIERDIRERVGLISVEFGERLRKKFIEAFDFV